MPTAAQVISGKQSRIVLTCAMSEGMV